MVRGGEYLRLEHLGALHLSFELCDLSVNRVIFFVRAATTAD